MLKIISNLFVDFTKLIFAGVIIGGIMRQEIDFLTLLLRGLSAMLVSTTIALIVHYYANLLNNKTNS